MFQLEGLAVQSLLVLVNFFGEDSGEIMGGEIGLHDFDLLAMGVFTGYALIADVVGTGLPPITFVTGFG